MSVTISDTAKSLLALSLEMNYNLGKIETLNKESIAIQEKFLADMKRISAAHENLILQNNALQETIGKLNAHI